MIAIIAGAILLPSHNALLSQGAVIGQVTQLKPVGQASRCRKAAGSVRNVLRLKRRDTTESLSAVPPTRPLKLGDSIVVAGSVDVRLSIDHETFGSGDFVLAPQLLCGANGAFDIAASTTNAADSGRYYVDVEADTLLVFKVNSGGAYFSWASRNHPCRLRIVAARVNAEVCGTQIAVTVDSGGQDGFLYVREGTVRFVDQPGVEAHAGQLFRLSSLTGPVLLSATQTAQLINPQNINYHSAEIWAETARAPALLSRLLRPPWIILVPAIATTTFVVIDRNSGPKSRTKTVVLKIPL